MARTLSAAEVPADFAEICKAIYGDAVDVRELWDLAKNAPDSSAVHVNTDVNSENTPAENAKRKGIAGGLLLGSVAETLGTARAVQAAGQKVKEPKVPSITGLREKTTLRSLGRKVRRLPDSKAGKVGEAALQAANLGVGLAAAHTLVSSTKDKQQVGKAFRLKPLNAGMLAHAPSAKAIRRGPKPKPVQPVGKALPRPKLVRVTGEEFVNGRRPIQAQRALGQHRAKPMSSMPRHRAEMPRRELTRTGKGVLAALPTGAAGVAADRRHDSTLAKSVTWRGEISKIDSDKRQVFGWASVSEINGETVVDLQGDIAPIEEIEKSAYTYVLESRIGGDMHSRVTKGLTANWNAPKHTADLIESFVVTPEKLEGMGLAPDALPLGWWLGFHVNDDEQWAMVKNGERTGFSIHGAGRREPVAKAAERKRTALARRADAVLRPPAPKLKPVSSSAIEAMGYLPQTRRLAIAMHSRPNEPYNYRVSPKRAREAESAPSLGSYYAREIRGKAKRATRYTLADRARLFIDPPDRVNKGIAPVLDAATDVATGVSRTGLAGRMGSTPAVPPAKRKKGILQPASVLPARMPPLGLPLNGSP